MPSNTIVYMFKLQQIHHTPLISKIITTNNAFLKQIRKVTKGGGKKSVATYYTYAFP